MVVATSGSSRNLVHEIDSCRICHSSDLKPVIDLGEQSLTGRFPAQDEADPPAAPLSLIRCAVCGLVQLRHSVDVDEMFGANYGYRSGINATMTRHLARIAEAIAARSELASGDSVLDIGCNDGTLLKSYPVARINRFGIDPIAEMFRKGYPSDLQILTDFFSAQKAIELVGEQRPRAITSISMFYDLEDPGTFVSDVADVLASDGIWVLEQSYLPLMLQRNSFDTICHEHLEYYAYEQIRRLATDNGLRVFDVILNEINGGSFQLWLCHNDAKYTDDNGSVERVERNELSMMLATEEPYKAFRERVAAIKEKLVNLVSDEVVKGKKIYVYGASTKGNVLLQYFGLDKSLIQGCADKNPTKWGRRTPGTSIPIVSENEARADADFFLVLPWHFREEFIEREADFRSRGGKLIFPLPNVEVV